MCDAEFIRTRKEYVLASHMLLFDEAQHRAIKRRKTSSKNAPKFAGRIERCILCLYPATFQDKPTATTVAVFREWVDSISHCPRTRKKLLKRMEPLNLHPDLAACIPRRSSAEDNTEMHRIFKAIGGAGAQMTRRACEAHIDRLRLLSPDHALSSIGDIAFNDAVHFCTDRGTLHPGRDAILGSTGFRHGDRLKVTLLMIPSLLSRFSTIRKTLPKNSKYSVKKYISVFLAFDERLLCLSSMTCEEVASVVLTITDAPAISFNMIRAELQDQHCDITISSLEKMLPSKYTGITAVDRLLGSSCSQWCNEMVNRVIEAELKSRLKRTFYRNKRTRQTRTEVGRVITFIAEYSTHKYDQPAGTDMLHWFLSCCTVEMVQECIQSYVGQCNVRNDLVKSAMDTHHAATPIHTILRLFQGGLKPFLACSDTVDGLTMEILQRTIENKRVPVDPLLRREYSDAEMEAMMEAAQDPRERLILTILREIGLRIAAICHLKCRMLIDENGEPREVCNVPEKRKSYRQFVTSKNLRQRISDHDAFMRASTDGEDEEERGDQYILNLLDPSAPISQTLINVMLARMAAEAHVEINVHAHAFRHTIVGTLIKCGNEMAIVSKFMGHKSIDTTYRNYWVSTIKELNANMNNPFTGTMQAKEEAKENDDLEKQILKAQKDKSLAMLTQMEAIILACNSPDTIRQLAREMPNLEEDKALVMENCCAPEAH
jgi:site-specific recombinase XerD